MSSTEGKHCSSRLERRLRRRSSWRCSRPARRSPSPRARTTAPECCSTSSNAGGVRHVEFDQTGPPPAEADLVWIEAPSNPFLTMPDFEAAVAHPAPVVCDSTAATPLHVRPLERGCQIALHSATKGLAGHDDALVGALVVGDPRRRRGCASSAPERAPIAAPDVAWLLLRGLQTLEVRVARQTRERPRDRGASPRPSRRRDRPLSRASGRSCRSTSSMPTPRRSVETGTRLIANKTSLGGVTSRIEARARWEGARVPAGLLRLSVGLEDPESSGTTSRRRWLTTV